MHPTKHITSESLSLEFLKSYTGFLLCIEPHKIIIDQELIRNAMNQLYCNIMIVCFVGGKIDDVGLKNSIERPRIINKRSYLALKKSWLKLLLFENYI